MKILILGAYIEVLKAPKILEFIFFAPTVLANMDFDHLRQKKIIF